MTNEQTPMGTIPPGTAERIAEAEEIKGIEERHAAVLPQEPDPQPSYETVMGYAAHADRARLLVLLRESLTREATLRADLREARGSAMEGEIAGVLYRRFRGVAGIAERNAATDEIMALLRGHPPQPPAPEPFVVVERTEAQDGQPDGTGGAGGRTTIRAALRPAGTLASLDDACDGSDR